MNIFQITTTSYIDIKVVQKEMDCRLNKSFHCHLQLTSRCDVTISQKSRRQHRSAKSGMPDRDQYLCLKSSVHQLPTHRLYIYVVIYLFRFSFVIICPSDSHELRFYCLIIWPTVLSQLSTIFLRRIPFLNVKVWVNMASSVLNVFI